jgi:TolB-like protein/DNA-binding winged helix-turn-helix (wHTH) protein/Flp pilus assembly protein TadD
MLAQENIYRFGDFTLAVREHCLRNGTQEIHLRPKVFDALLYLLERQGRLVSKGELLDGIWPDVIVSENTLNKCVEELRKALRDNPHDPLFIQTISRVGFKFIAPVKKSILPVPTEIEASHEKSGLPGGSEAAAESYDPEKASYSTASARRIRRNVVGATAIILLLIAIAAGVKFLHGGDRPAFESLAVLPFTNLSASPEQEYFTDGITEALIANLAQTQSLRVISRTSVMRYKELRKPLPEIARELNVDLVIEGSVLRYDNRVRIVVQLIDARSDRHLWVKSFERDIQDIPVLQQELSLAITRKIRSELMPRQKTEGVAATDPHAYEAYLKGRHFWNKRTAIGFRKGIQYFEEAIIRDSTNALAYVGLADCYNMLGNYDILAPARVYLKAKEALARALNIDSDLAEAQASLAFTKMFYEWDLQGAERDLIQAIELNPNYADAHHWYGLCLAMQQRFDEALVEMNQARTLDPLSTIINTNIGWVYYFARDYNKAVSQFRQSLELNSNFVSAHVKLGWAYEQLQMHEEALAEFQMGMRLQENDPALHAILGRAYAAANRKEEAYAIISQLENRADREYVTAYMIAVIYTGLGDRDKAFEWLQTAYRNRDGWLAWLKVDPKLDTLRADPRFGELLVDVGLN